MLKLRIDYLSCVCGEIGGDLEYIPILLGMGLDEFSMNPIRILESRRLISNLSVKECKNNILKCK